MREESGGCGSICRKRLLIKNDGCGRNTVSLKRRLRYGSQGILTFCLEARVRSIISLRLGLANLELCFLKVLLLLLLAPVTVAHLSTFVKQFKLANVREDRVHVERSPRYSKSCRTIF